MIPTRTTPTPPQLLVTEHGAAEILLLTTRTVRNLSKRGELPKVKIGRSTRYRVADIEALIARGIAGQASEAPAPAPSLDELGMVR